MLERMRERARMNCCLLGKRELCKHICVNFSGQSMPWTKSEDFFKAIWPTGPQARITLRLLYYQIDFYGPDARNGFTSGFTASNAQIAHQTWKVSLRNYSHIPVPSLHPSLSAPIQNFHHNPRITEINSFIGAKPAPD